MPVGRRGCLLLTALVTSACAGPSRPPPPPMVVTEGRAAEVVALPAQPPMPAPRYDPVRPAVSYLDADLASLPERRAKPRRYGPLRAGEAEDTAALTALPEGDDEMVVPDPVRVVEARPGAVRIFLEHEGVRLVAYLDHASLHPVVTKPTLLERPGYTGLFVEPGVVVPDGKGARRPLAIDNGELKAEGWVREAAVGWTYRPRVWPDLDLDFMTIAGTTIVDDGGAPILDLASGFLVAQVELRGDRARVHYRSEELSFEGWAPASRVDPQVIGNLWGTAVGNLDGGAGGPMMRLHRGVPLRAGPSGEIIGRVDQRVLVVMDPATPEGRMVSVRFGPWGPVRLFVDAAHVAYSEHAEAVYRSRVAITPLPGQPRLPRAIEQRVHDVRACWQTALDAGAHAKERIRVAIADPKSVELRPRPRDPKLAACIEQAYLRLHSAAKQLPAELEVELSPTPLPPLP
ncbi:MAG: hypothetical protein R3B72_05950 [Polyangiaceae bacterium]